MVAKGRLSTGCHSGGRLTVDLDALAANFRTLASLAGGSRCAAVVKADAYGLGVETVARRLVRSGCDCFIVANLEEGLELRAILPTETIYVLEGFRPEQQPALIAADLRPVINTPEQLKQWAACGAEAPCALHVDTGMSRLGLTPEDARDLAAEGLGTVNVDYLMTHLACADLPGHEVTELQVALFAELQRLFPTLPTSVGNTAGIESGQSLQGDLVRAGIGLYGGNPLTAAGCPSLPVATLEGRVLQVRVVPPGTTVGYGAEYRARDTATLATLGIGYADGYPRNLGNRGYGVVQGHRVPVVGRVSMDSMVVDITSLPTGTVAAGDWVELLGANANLDEIATLAGTISYEILTRLGPRLERRYLSAV